MKKQHLLAVLLSVAVIPSAIGADLGEPRATFYVELPIDASSAHERAPHVGFMFGTKSIPVFGFALSRNAYRRKAVGDSIDPFEASDFNWWLIGGITAAVVLVASQSKKARREDQNTLANMPPPP
jgi:hypothetical protein